MNEERWGFHTVVSVADVSSDVEWQMCMKMQHIYLAAYSPAFQQAAGQ